ncbi:MAG: ABC transporter ATP-binding protein [Acidobacteria bacterium]|nr:ABC transporter ATP-binding protein [Acidobacteriota bacterium]
MNLRQFIVPYWRSLTLILVLGTIATLSGLAQPYFTKLLIDDALLARNFQLLLWISAGMLGVTALSYALNAWTGYRYMRVSAAILFDMRKAVYEHLQRLSPRFYAKTRIGEIVSRLNNDVGEIQRISADTFLALTTNVLFLIGTIGMMLYLNTWLATLTFALMPVTVYGLQRTRRLLEKETENVRQRGSDIGSFLIETLMGMRTTVLMNREKYEVGRFQQANDRFVTALLKRQRAAIAAGLIPSASLSVGTLLVFVVGGYQVIAESMKLGEFVAFMAYQTRMMAPVQNVMTLYTNLATFKVAVKRVMELMDVKPDVVEGSGVRGWAAEGGRVREAIEFHSVSFRHDRETIFEEATFTIPAGSFCVVLGSSGAGKSSIADLMVRLYDPDAGSIQIDGIDLREFRLADLRRHIVLVEQDTFLFNGTIEENIRYGGGIDPIPNFLTLPTATVVGDRGLALSGGEKQTIGIARALARNSQVLILDEATSAMDTDLESRVLAELRQIMSGRTIILITHRAYLAQLADIVLHVENGRVLVEACSKSL